MKFAGVTLISKAKEQMFFENYCLIPLLSLYSLFAKILERLMYNRVMKFLRRHNPFHKEIPIRIMK